MKVIKFKISHEVGTSVPTFLFNQHPSDILSSARRPVLLGCICSNLLSDGMRVNSSVQITRHTFIAMLHTVLTCSDTLGPRYSVSSSRRNRFCN